MLMILLVGPFIAFIATAVLIVLLRPVAMSIGLVDLPNQRSAHQAPTPLIGGLSIYLAISAAYLVPALLNVVPINRELVSFFLGGLVLVGVGVLDDYLDLTPAFRFMAQIAASLIMIYGGGVVLTDLGAMTPSREILELGSLAVPFTVFATLGVINALNMCDGLDGLSGTLALISITGLGITVFINGVNIDAFLMMILAASIFAFLLFNFRLPRRARASVFLGDAGSMFLGYTLTWLAISLSQGGERIITPASALWFLMLPIFDTVAMMLRRLIQRRSPFRADREHIHHVFLLAGFSVNETVTIMSSAALIGAGIGLLSMDLRAPEFSVAGLFLICGILYFWMVLRAWKIMRFIERPICRRKGLKDRRSGIDRRKSRDLAYAGPERRAGVDRRGHVRRSEDRRHPASISIPG
jgi:UDP-GlcNAc:undecaprenyl-phosphate GlcNAc-1-phosphate transferase